MSVFSRTSSLAIVLAALCLGGQTADAQVAPVPYWMQSWPVGFGGNPTTDQNANSYGNPDGNDARGRYNFPNGWFVGSDRSMNLSMSGINQAAAFGGTRALSYEGVQFGYNFQNAPVSVFAGFNTLKYNTGPGGAFAAFDSTSGTLPGGYSAQAGVEFRPTSNLSLSLGVGFTQQPTTRIDSDINSPLLPGATPLAIGGRR